MVEYFNIKYEFDKETIIKSIEKQIEKRKSDYICVADGVILSIANRKKDFLEIVNGGMFSICDSSYVPLYIKWIHNKKYNQYCGSQIFIDIINLKKYRMMFLGTSSNILNNLKRELMKIDPNIRNMTFLELPYKNVEDFNYKQISEIIDLDKAEIIWIALGAPKQEYFMSLLKPHLQKGVMIAVGAAFKFYSGIDERRAPNWMIKYHLEFVFRILKDPKKQIKRCLGIIHTLPKLLYKEWKHKKGLL